MRQRLSAAVSNERDSRTDTMSYCENPHHRDNVNVAQGPRTGNAGAHSAKRGNFKAAKEERYALSEMVERAFGARGKDDREEENPGLESIKANSKEKFKSKK